MVFHTRFQQPFCIFGLFEFLAMPKEELLPIFVPKCFPWHNFPICLFNVWFISAWSLDWSLHRVCKSHFIWISIFHRLFLLKKWGPLSAASPPGIRNLEIISVSKNLITSLALFVWRRNASGHPEKVSANTNDYVYPLGFSNSEKLICQYSRYFLPFLVQGLLRILGLLFKTYPAPLDSTFARQ